jgi:hypothetical protein
VLAARVPGRERVASVAPRAAANANANAGDRDRADAEAPRAGAAANLSERTPGARRDLDTWVILPIKRMSMSLLFLDSRGCHPLPGVTLRLSALRCLLSRLGSN